MKQLFFLTLFFWAASLFSQCTAYTADVVAKYRSKGLVQTGVLYLNQPFNEVVRIELFNPETQAKAASWELHQNKWTRLLDNGQPLTVGSDWGIRYINAANEASCTCILGEIATFKQDKGYFSVSLSAVKKPSEALARKHIIVK